MHFQVSGDNVFANFAGYANALGRDGLKIGVQALNTLGPETRKDVIRTEAKATGLSVRILGRALHETRATATSPSYLITASGGEVSLHYFGAKETAEGVSAKGFGQRTVSPGTFMKAGSFAKGRVSVDRWNGQVFRRTGGLTDGFRKGSKRRMDAFEKVKSGVVIPKEMTTGAPLKAFETMAGRVDGVVARRLSVYGA
jgi:hypothetical protein